MITYEPLKGTSIQEAIKHCLKMIQEYPIVHVELKFNGRIFIIDAMDTYENALSNWQVTVATSEIQEEHPSV